MKLKTLIVLLLITIISSCARVAFNCPRQYVAYGKNVLSDSIANTRAEIVEFSGKCRLQEQVVYHTINVKLETASGSKADLRPIKDLSIVVIDSSGEIVSQKKLNFIISEGTLNTVSLDEELSFDLSNIEASLTSFSIVAGFF